MTVFTAVATGFKFLEAGRVAADGALFFSDYTLGGVHRLDADGERRSWLAGVGAIGGLAFNEDGRLIVSTSDGLWLLDLENDRRTLLAIETEGARSFNDIEPDGDGGFYVGTIDLAARGAGRPPSYGELLHVAPDGRCTVLAHDIGAANGIGVDAAQRSLYLSDTGAGVWRFPLAAPGVVGKRELLFAMPDSDGLTIDADGFVWVAAWQSGAIVRIDPTDGTATRHPLPEGQAMTLAFGGEDLRDLYVFGGRDVTDPGAPATASIFRMRVRSRGLPTAETAIRIGESRPLPQPA